MESGCEKPWSPGAYSQQTLPNFNQKKQWMARIEPSKIPAGRRDEAWIHKVKQRRTALSNLWAEYREQLRKSLCSAGLTKEHINIELARTSFDKTPGHLATLQNEKENILACLHKPKHPQPGLELPQWSKSSPAQESRMIHAAAQKPKIKSRTAPSTASAVSQEPAVIDIPHGEEPEFRIKHKQESPSHLLQQVALPREREGCTELVEWRR